MIKTPMSLRPHIAIFGRRNTGKSSLINAITNQGTALVSRHKGTTTDPVYKTMEILPLGPIVLIDTAGIDDTGELGELRIKRTEDVINKIDVGIIVFDVNQTDFSYEKELIRKIKNKHKDYILVANKSDIKHKKLDYSKMFTKEVLKVSSLSKVGIKELKEVIGHLLNIEIQNKPLVSEFVSKGDVIILVTPIDSAAPKGRIILPQQQTLREILDVGGISIVIQATQLKETLNKIKPKLVITDSQVFEYVSEITPLDVKLTSFSILFARSKGNLNALVSGVKALDSLVDGANILISEGCTHHRQCEDIGTVKIPSWLKEYTKKKFNIKYSSGHTFEEELKGVDLVIHCGACMLNKNEMEYRLESVNNRKIPIINYGIFIAYIHGIFKRAVEIFPETKDIWE
ncbi:MAG: [FeFe] hydrogenase H-cluster maturation GTPase HydF [Candidatus Izemoplasma sp.]